MALVAAAGGWLFWVWRPDAAPSNRWPAGPPSLSGLSESPAGGGAAEPAQAVETERLAALWQPVALADVAPGDIPAYKEVVAGRVLVRFADPLGGWAVGDRFAVAIPQLNARYAPTVDRIARGPGTIRTYAGTLHTDDRRDYGYVLTVSDRNTFAHLSTPFGLYEVVGDDRFGWLMPTANMDQHRDLSVPDYRPPRPATVGGTSGPGFVRESTSRP